MSGLCIILCLIKFVYVLYTQSETLINYLLSYLLTYLQNLTVKGQNASDLLDTFVINAILPVITKPTRITYTSAAIIDNLYIKGDKYDNLQSRIRSLDILIIIQSLFALEMSQSVKK